MDNLFAENGRSIYNTRSTFGVVAADADAVVAVCACVRWTFSIQIMNGEKWKIQFNGMAKREVIASECCTPQKKKKMKIESKMR